MKSWKDSLKKNIENNKYLLIISIILISLLICYLNYTLLILLLLLTFLFYLIKKPLLGVYLWIIFLPIQLNFTQNLFGLNFAPSDIFILFSFIGIIIYYIKNNIKITKISILPYLIILLIIFTISLLTRQSFLGNISRFAILNKYLGFIFLIITTITIILTGRLKKNSENIIKVLLISSLIISSLSLILYFFNFFTTKLLFDFLSISRIKGFLLNPNAYGIYLIVPFFISLSLLIKKEFLVSKKILILNSILLFISLIITFSRSTWIATMIGLILLVFIYNLKAAKKILLVIVSSIIILLILFKNQFLEIFLFRAGRTNSIDIRIEIIKNAVYYFVNHPLLGIGLGSFRDVSIQFLEKELIVHNTYLWFLTEMGLIGLIFLCLFFIKILINYISTIKKSPKKALSIGALISFIVILIIMNGIEAFYQRPLWLLIALSEILYLKGEK